MKVTEQELIELITELKRDAVQWLIANNEQGGSHNSARAGMEEGTIMACNQILDWIRKGVEE